MCERQVGQPPVKRIRGNACDAKVPRDVLVKGVKVLGADARAIEVYARVVDHLAEGAHVSDGNVIAAGASGASDAGKRIGQVRAGGVVVEAESQVISRPALGSPVRRPLLVPPKAWFRRMFRSSLSLSVDVTK